MTPPTPLSDKSKETLLKSSKLDISDDRRPQTPKRRRVLSSPDLRHGVEKEYSGEFENNTLDDILEALEQITKATQKPDGKGNLIFGTEEQLQVSNAKEIIYRNIIKMNKRTNGIELENMALRMKNTASTKNTYASALNTDKNTSRVKNNESQPWTTPEANKIRHQIMISTANEQEQKNTKTKWAEIKKSINRDEIKGGLRDVRETNSGAIILETHNKQQKERLTEMLRTHKEMKVKDLHDADPYFLITGVEKGFRHEEFKNILWQQNEDLMLKFDEVRFKRDVKVVTKRTCRNALKENWLLQAPADIFKYLVKKETVAFDLMRVHVQEYINISVCFRCSSFGHVAKFCKSRPCCLNCGGRHEAKDCDKSALNCPNCERAAITARSHTARDPNCPCYKKKCEQLRKQTNYSTSVNIDHKMSDMDL